MLESLNYSIRNPPPKKNLNLSNLPHETVEKLQKNHGVVRGPQLDKQRWRARLGILRLKTSKIDLKGWRPERVWLLWRSWCAACLKVKYVVLSRCWNFSALACWWLTIACCTNYRCDCLNCFKLHGICTSIVTMLQLQYFKKSKNLNNFTSPFYVTYVATFSAVEVQGQ
jgi:hypothetical protein